MSLLRVGRTVWDPWREISRMQQEMTRLLNGARMAPDPFSREYPAVNVYANEHHLLLTAELPGIDPEKLDITVAGDALTLKGERPAEPQPEGDTFHRRERPVGAFTRTVQLPFEVDPNLTEARYERGVLHVRLSRPEAARPRKVTVRCE